MVETRKIIEMREVILSELGAAAPRQAVPWRCHRSLVADALSVRGFRSAIRYPP
jgi:uncharacterized protein (DUF488 family)